MKQFLMPVVLALLVAGCSSPSGGNKETPGDRGVYIDSTAPTGGDGSRQNPFNTLLAVTFEGGKTYFLARGSHFEEILDLSGIDASAESPLVIAAYTPANGATQPPLIDGTRASGRFVALYSV